MLDIFRLDGRVAVITGGASGIGESAARLFSAAGATVILVDVNEPKAREVAASIGNAEAKSCDITDENQVKEFFASLTDLHILFNCAGVGLVGNIEETELAELQRLFRVNVEGTYLMSKAALPLLTKVRGSILNMGSVAGLVGVRRRFAYCATKGAVTALTRQLAVDYPTSLRVNCIAPGTVDTPFVEGYLEKYHKSEKDKVRAELNERQPLGRLARPDEIAALALYICSPAAEFMNGSVVTIDGGWTAA